MKKMKNLFSLVLTLVMVFSMTMTAFAGDMGSDGDGTHKVTISGVPGDGYAYEAYQIFKGTVSGEVLVDIEWGDNINVTDELKAELAKKFGLEEEKLTAYNVAKVLSQDTKKDSDNAVWFANTVSHYLTGTPKDSVRTGGSADDGYIYEITGLESGYYFIKDKTGSADDSGEAYTKFILSLLKGDAEATVKTEIPTVDKTVADESDEENNESSQVWGEAADHDMNEVFQFKLEAKLAKDSGFNYYDTYKLVFHDTLSAGLDFGKIVSVKLYVGDDTRGADITTYTATYDGGNITNPNGEAGLSWTLEITDLVDLLSDGQKLGDGIRVEVIYTAELNTNAAYGYDDSNRNTVFLEYSNNPNEEGTGETTPDTVYVFTYDLPSVKVDGDTVAEGVDKVYLEDAEFVLYRMEGNTKSYALLSDGKVIGWSSEISDSCKIKSGTDGKFTIIGLDAGTYYLQETQAPVGYNKLKEDVKITIKAQHTEKGDESGAEVVIEHNGKVEDGFLNEIYNFKGVTLPDTGGIGTTIFYVVGGVLVLAAVVLLVTKKRMSVEKK